MSLQLLITNIQRTSFHDGPGIRTTVFLKGCSLRCFWCHNPETLSTGYEMRYIPSRCIHCGMCIETCRKLSGLKDLQSPEDIVKYVRIHENCSKCFRCEERCPTQALVPAAKWYKEDEIIPLLLADQDYYKNSGGGVTFSGGEPLLQWRNLSSVMKLLKNEGISIAIDTAGNVPWEAFQNVLDKANLFLFDLKAADSDLHRKVTGSSNELILENLKNLYQENAAVKIRIPLITGVNTSSEEQEKIAEILAKYPKLEGVEMIPFHRTALSKYRQLGMNYQAAGLVPPDSQTLRQIVEKMNQRLSVPVICRGL